MSATRETKSGIVATGRKRATAVEFAAAELREAILSGALAPGARIRLDDVATELEMSPIPLREALRTLITERLVVPLPHRGYIVAPVTVEDLDETYRLRLLLEPLAVELAVPRLDDGDIARLREELALLERAFASGDWDSHRLHHRNFHFGIYERSGSPWIISFTDMLWLNAQRYQRMTTRIGGELGRRRQEHRQILNACEQRDAETAATKMHEHLARAAATIRNFLVSSDGEKPGKARVRRVGL